MRSKSALKISPLQARALWFDKQGIARAARAGVDSVLRQAGWITTAGAAGPYIALRARLEGLSRSDVDRILFEEGKILEVPAMRGCTMLVSREDAGLALLCARRYDADRFEKLRETCVVTEREVKQLADALATILQTGPATLEELRGGVPQHLMRSLGEEGKQLGESSTLTVALRHLRKQGSVQRYATNHRLDSSQYSYRLFLPNPLEKSGLPSDEREILQELARRFFDWAGPATLKEFAWWVGFSQREVKEACQGIDLVQVSVTGWTDNALLAAEDVERLRASPEEEEPTICLLPFRDNYLSFRRGMNVLVKPEEAQVEVLDWRNRPAPIASLDGLHNHAILAGGRLVGLWDYDAEQGQVIWGTFGKISTKQRRQLVSQIEELEAFIRSELGDVQFYALDNSRNRRQRVEAILQLTADN